jgi:acyl-CoA reductase-like NAD-dependent aldehyde dehydrogenase
VLEDADIEHTARTLVFGGLANSGQICMSTERVIVLRSVFLKLLSAVTDLAPTIRAGPGGKIGALFNETAAEGVVSMISDAEKDGAKIVLGEKTRDGAVVQPHVVTDVKPWMRLWERESFGPGTYIK